MYIAFLQQMQYPGLSVSVFLSCFRRPIPDRRLWQTDSGMIWLYSIDAADNLFPSIHCLVSWFCFLGIRGRQEIPKWYQYLSCVIAVCVFLSTLMTKQHVVWDVAGGVILAQICFTGKHSGIGYIKDFVKGYKAVFFI